MGQHARGTSGGPCVRMTHAAQCGMVLCVVVSGTALGHAAPNDGAVCVLLCW
jgi:hypothetical protein